MALFRLEIAIRSFFTAIDIPIFLKIPATDVDSCNSEIGQVLGILSIHGMDGTLLSCSTYEFYLDNSTPGVALCRL